MDSVAKVSAEAVPAAGNMIVNVMAIACGLALALFASVATNGLDMSAGFF
jgi:hypothetical protein